MKAGFSPDRVRGSARRHGRRPLAVIVYATIERYGFTNLLISTVLAGVLMFALG